MLLLLLRLSGRDGVSGWRLLRWWRYLLLFLVKLVRWLRAERHDVVVKHWLHEGGTGYNARDLQSPACEMSHCAVGLRHLDGPALHDAVVLGKGVHVRRLPGEAGDGLIIGDADEDVSA